MTATSHDGVQSVHRALAILEAVESAGGTSAISAIAAATGLALPTTHRLVQTLLDRGYLRQLPDRRYCLGSRLVPLGASANLLLGARTLPLLRQLAAELSESVNLAVLVGGLAEYVSQAPGPRSMRMFTEVGRRVDLYCTGVGKALLSTLSPQDARAALGQSPLVRHTSATITDLDQVLTEAARTRSRGYAIDEGEMEVGVRCVAVPVALPTPMALSVSGPTERMGPGLIERAVPMLQLASTELAAIMTGDGQNRP